METILMGMCQKVRIAKEQCRLGVFQQMHGGSTKCTEMCGNGAKTCINQVIGEPSQMEGHGSWGLIKPLVCYEVARGTVVLKIVVRLTVSEIHLIFASTVLGFEWLQ